MKERNKKSKNINPLWILLIGIIFFFVGSAIGGMVGSSIAVVGEIFAVVGIINGIIYLIRRNK